MNTWKNGYESYVWLDLMKGDNGYINNKCDKKIEKSRNFDRKE